MPHRGPWSEYFHCNDYRFANPKHNAGASGWYTQRYHRFKGHRPWLTTGVTAPNPDAPRAMAHRPAPPSSRCTAPGQGLKSWGGGFIFQKLGLKPPTTVGKGPTVCRMLSKPLIASTLVGGVSVKWDNFYI